MLCSTVYETFLIADYDEILSRKPGHLNFCTVGMFLFINCKVLAPKYVCH